MITTLKNYRNELELKFNDIYNKYFIFSLDFNKVLDAFDSLEEATKEFNDRVDFSEMCRFA